MVESGKSGLRGAEGLTGALEDTWADIEEGFVFAVVRLYSGHRWEDEERDEEEDEEEEEEESDEEKDD